LWLGCLEQSLVGKERNLGIPDSSYTASSHYISPEVKNDARYEPHNAKLNGSNGWATKTLVDPDDYLQIDLGTPRIITAVATQGNGFYDEWVTSYKVNHTSNLKNWTTYPENHFLKIFDGNTDRYTVVRHNLKKTITARYIRFIPVSYHTYKTMRVNVYVNGQLQGMHLTFWK
ncbi:lactadherin-like, partial [Actinia tenebrosa]|uniref:Lactadherin-like n=1 Tax=Actinia tenebrosa TaxID=6105 RepID=A0A6P8HNA1_ACTTE